MFSIMLALCLFGQNIQISGKVSQFITVDAKLSGDIVRYYPIDSGLSVFPSDLLAQKTVTVVVGSKVGNYRILAYTAKLDGNKAIPSEPTVITLSLTDENSVVPTVYDDILDKLRDSYSKETSATKLQDIKDMSYVLKCSMQLTYEMLSDYNAYVRENLSKNQSLIVKKAVSEMMAKEFGSDDVRMDEKQQEKVNKLVIRIVAALDSLAKR